MKILIACEFSGIVRDAFIARGHDAISCDLLPTEHPGPHYQGDVMDIINDGWDIMIGHPPCTFLTNCGVRWFKTDPSRMDKMKDGAEFFLKLWNAPIDKICLENPIMHCYSREIIKTKYDQIIQPYWFGDSVQKSTCLWLKNLSRLKPTNIVDRGMIYVDPRGNKHGGKFTNRAKNAYSPLMLLPKNNKRAQIRSTTFQGIANAMAEQWG
jgi:hypothetical protein